MTVATFTQPNFTAPAQLGSAYKGNIDGAAAVFSRIAAAFAPHEQSTPNMTVRVDAGYVFAPSALPWTLYEIAAQNSGTITAPTTNPRIDRVVIDAFSGLVSVVTGTEAASPAAPSIPAGKSPLARIALQTSTAAITNSMLTDERLPAGAVTSALIGIPDGLATLNSSGKLPTAQVLAYTGTHTTALLSPSSTEVHDITHNLGTDDLIVDICARCDGAAPAWGCQITVGGSLYSRWEQGAVAWSYSQVSTPASGIVRLLLKNLLASNSTVTVAYAIRPRT